MMDVYDYLESCDKPELLRILKGVMDTGNIFDTVQKMTEKRRRELGPWAVLQASTSCADLLKCAAPKLDDALEAEWDNRPLFVVAECLDAVHGHARKIEVLLPLPEDKFFNSVIRTMAELSDRRPGRDWDAGVERLQCALSDGAEALPAEFLAKAHEEMGRMCRSQEVKGRSDYPPSGADDGLERARKKLKKSSDACGFCGATAKKSSDGGNDSTELYKCLTCDAMVCDECSNVCDSKDHEVELDAEAD